MKTKQFLKKATKYNIVFASVVACIAIIATIMIALLLQTENMAKATTCFSLSAIVVLVASIWIGVLQIHVFNDYKSQRKSLCAEGIFNICITVLILITCALFIVIQVPQISESNAITSMDLRYFIGGFLIAFAAWKGATVWISIKEKRFNWWIEIVIGLLWLALGILVILSIGANKEKLTVLFWVAFVVLNVMLAAYTFYLLYTYIFKTPTYLETPEAIALLEKDILDRNNRLARLNAMANGGYVQTPVAPVAPVNNGEDLETKLNKLKTLKDKGVLTEEEYQAKRKEIIDESL